MIDPIDATVNFVRGVPVWETLIALRDRWRGGGGVVSAPALRSRWWAGRGLGAWANARRVTVSATNRIEDAHLDQLRRHP